MLEEKDIEVGDSDESPVDVDLEEGKVVQEEDDTPNVEAVSEDQKEEELEQYSAGVQKRVDQLTRRFREEERQKQAAIDFAESVKKRNSELEKRIENLDKGYQEEFGNRVESQVDVAKKVLKDAHESGDVDKIVEAQEALANLSVDRVRLKTAQKQAEEVELSPEPVMGTAEQPVIPHVPSAEQVMDQQPKLKEWVSRNEWFGPDEIMTQAAFYIDSQLQQQEGFDPNTDEYYAEIDRRMLAEFPHKLGRTNGGGKKVASAEASASRNKSKRKTVRLTSSQVAIANRLNVPLEEYAKYV